MKRLSVAACRDGWTCPSVWDPEDGTLVIVGHPVEDDTVPLGEGEVAIRIDRTIVANAEVR